MTWLLVTGLLIQGLSTPGPEVASVFLPGNEARAVDLIAPHDSDTMHLAGWDLTEMTAGPDCAVRLDFQDPDHARATLKVSPPSAAGEAFVLVEEVSPPAVRVGPLCTALEALVLENQASAVFHEVCKTLEVDPVEQPSLAGGLDNLPAPLVPAGRHALLALLILLPLMGMGLFFLRGAPSRSVTTSSVETRQRWPRLAVLMAVSLGLRLFVARHLAPGDLELENFPTDTSLWDLTHVLGSFVGLPPPSSFHAPLLSSLLQPWFILGDALGVGGQVLWLRLPNLALSAVMIWLLLRLGEALSAPRAGWLAAILFGLTPSLVHLSVPQGHYFLEMVACTWFLERLAVSALKGRAVHRTLVLAGALALWSGFLSALIVGPGILIHGILTWRRGDRRRALAVLLLAAALVAPVAGSALTSALNMAAISSAAAPDNATDEGLAAIYGHTTMKPMAQDLRETLEVPLRLAQTVTGHAAPLFLILLLALAVLRPRVGWIPLAVLLIDMALATTLPIRLNNLTTTFPLILMGGTWSATILADRWLPSRARPLALTGLALLAILTSAARTTPTGYIDRPLVVHAKAWLSTGDAVQALTPISAPEHRDLPVVRESQIGNGSWFFCPDLVTWRGVRDCLNTPRDRVEPELERYLLGGREFWEIKFPPGRNPRCPAPLTSGWTIPWGPGPFLLVIDADFKRWVTALGCVDVIDPERCRSLGRSPEMELLRCE